MLLAQLGAYIDGLYRYAQHLLQYYEALGDLPAGHLSVEDVVDTAVLGAYRDLEKKKPPADLRARLMEIAQCYVQSEAARMIARRELTVSKEEDVPETPPEEEVMRLGEQIFDFFEPDEDLKLEDVVPDAEVPPADEAVERAELRRCVNAALAGMPAEWRRALSLRYTRQLEGQALADALKKSEQETSNLLERARAYLRQKLLESECIFAPQEEPHAKPTSRVQAPTRVQTPR